MLIGPVGRAQPSPRRFLPPRTSKVNAKITRQLGMREVGIFAIAGVLIGIMVVVLFVCVLPLSGEMVGE